jgi:hypothetical protein
LPHESDDELKPAETIVKKYKFHYESMPDFSRGIARSHYAREIYDTAIDSLHADIHVLQYLQQLSSTCTDDPLAVPKPPGLIQLQVRLVKEFNLIAQLQRGDAARFDMGPTNVRVQTDNGG